MGIQQVSFQGNGCVDGKSYTYLVQMFKDKGVKYPRMHAIFEADQYRRLNDDPKYEMVLAEDLVAQYLAPDWLPLYISGDLHDALSKASRNPYLKGAICTAPEEFSVKLFEVLDKSFEFTKLDLSEADPLKASGVRKRWLAKELITFLEDRIELQAKNVRYISLPLWSDLLFRFKRDGISFTLRSLAQTLPKATIVRHSTNIKPAKILRAAFKEAPDSAISAAAGFVADILRERCDDILENYDIMTTGDISMVYTLPFVPRGSLGESCMRKMDAKAFEIYDSYMPNTMIAYAVNEYGDLIGRALVHDGVKVWGTDDEYSIMDRIYSTDAEVLTAFKIWAKKNGYWRKLEQKLGESNYVSPDGEVKDLGIIGVDCSVINEGEFDQVPYVDTFSCYSEQDPHTLWSECIADIERNGEWHCLKETEGYDTEGFFTKKTGAMQCRCCNASLSSSEINRGPNYDYDIQDVYCNECFSEQYFECAICGGVHDRDDCNFVEDEDIEICDDCKRDKFAECCLCHAIVRKDDAVEFWNEDGEEDHICESCRQKDERVRECAYCEGATHKSDLETVHTANYREEEWCSDCRERSATRCSCCDELYQDSLIVSQKRYKDGSYTKQHYCEDCWSDKKDGLCGVTCKCQCDNNTCLQGSGRWLECTKKFTPEADLTIVDSQEILLCAHCGEPIWGIGNGKDENMVDEQGNVYHVLCYFKARRENPHPCTVCSRYQADVFSMLGQSMCDKCILKTKEGEERFVQGLKNCTDDIYE